MKIEVEIPDGVNCNATCPFFIEETPKYQQFCSYVGKAFHSKKKLEECPANPRSRLSPAMKE